MIARRCEGNSVALPRYRVIQLQIAGIVLSIAAVAALFAVVLTRDSEVSDREYEQATTCPGLADTRQTTTDPDESLRAIYLDRFDYDEFR